MDTESIKEVRDPRLWAAFEDFCKWMSLPRHYSKESRETLEAKGLPDDLIELALIKTRTEFSKKYDVSYSTVTNWDSHPELLKRVKANWKQWCKRYTPNVLAKFYEKLMEEGDAARMKIWMQTVEEEVATDDKPNTLNIGIQAVLKNMLADGDIKEAIGTTNEKTNEVKDTLEDPLVITVEEGRPIVEQITIDTKSEKN